MAILTLEYSAADSEIITHIEAERLLPISSASISNLAGGPDLVQQVFEITPPLLSAVVAIFALRGKLQRHRRVIVNGTALDAQGYSADEVKAIILASTGGGNSPR